MAPAWTPPPPSARAGWVHGSTLTKDGTTRRYQSVSQMEQADKCLRKWHWQYVSGRKPPEQDWQKLGKEVHAQIETYLKGGPKTFGQIAMAGFHMIPTPGPDLLIERDLLARLDEPDAVITAKNSQDYLDNAVVRAAGVPLLGSIDLAHNRGTNKGGSEVSETQDPEGTWEVLDWKTSSDFKWAKTPVQLSHSIQMLGYAVWIVKQRADAKHVRLSHGVFRTKGAPAARKATYLASSDEILENWEHAEGVARLMNASVAEKDSNRVQFNLDACDDFRGCPHRTYCSAGMDVGISAYLGISATKNLLPQDQKQRLLPVGSLLKKIAPQAAQTTSNAPMATIGPADPVAAARLALEEQERQAEIRARIAEGFPEAHTAVCALNVGYPTLKGGSEIAKAYWALKGLVAHAEVPGTGQYGYVELEEQSQMSDLLEDLRAALGDEATPAASPLPPDAPISNPALAAKDSEGEAVLAPLPPAPPAPAVSGVVAAVKKEKAKKEAKAAPAAPTAQESRDYIAASMAHYLAPEQIEMTYAKEAEARNLFVDCLPAGPGPTVDLHDYVSEIAKRLIETVGGANTLDLRAASNDSPLGFGRWVGALAAMVASEEHSPLPPGTSFVLDTRGNQIREVVADALRERILASGGMYVRGIR